MKKKKEVKYKVFSVEKSLKYSNLRQERMKNQTVLTRQGFP